MNSSDVTSSVFTNSELVRAYAELAWPLVFLICFFVFLVKYGNELKTLFQRIRRAKIAGGEIELEELKQNASEVSKIDITEETKPTYENQTLVKDTNEKSISRLMAEVNAQQASLFPYPLRTDTIAKINDITDTDPIGAIVLTYNELARELEKLALTKGLLTGHKYRKNQFRVLLDIVSKNYELPSVFARACLQFQLQRNQLAHGAYISNFQTKDTIDIAEAGVELLIFALRIPRPVLIVDEANITLYKSESLEDRIEEFVGLELIFAATPGSTGSRAIVPMKPDLDLKPGDQVSSVWGEWLSGTDGWISGPRDTGPELIWKDSVQVFEGQPIITNLD